VGVENERLLELVSPKSILGLSSMSPLVLYGVSGVGKTVIAHVLVARFAMAVDRRGLSLVTGGDFARQFAHAIEADDMDRFRQRYRDCRLLMIDGIHEMVGKDSAQEELIHCLESMREHDRPVIVTSHKLPGAIRGLRPALSSRLMGGNTVEIVAPGMQARAEILKQLASQLQIRLTADEIDQLSSQLPPGTIVPQLKGILLKWSHQQRVTPEQEREGSLQQLIDHQVQSRIPAIADIAKAVSKQLGVRMSDLRGATRKAQIVRARSLAMHLARQMTPASLLQIGEYFGGRDHTTVMHACRKTEGDLLHNTELSRVADEIRQQLR
jgi:chromosomal replication initiator protein